MTIPKNKMVVVTGLSGSGKSSLAFDTLYAEGQRRYVQSLSAYARQFLGQMDKPDVDSIEGLSPAISIDQKNDLKKTPVQLWGRSRKSTIIFGYFGPAWARQFVLTMGRSLRVNPLNRWSIRSWHYQKRLVYKFCRRLSGKKKGQHKKVFEKNQA